MSTIAVPRYLLDFISCMSFSHNLSLVMADDRDSLITFDGILLGSGDFQRVAWIVRGREGS